MWLCRPLTPILPNSLFRSRLNKRDGRAIYLPELMHLPDYPFYEFSDNEMAKRGGDAKKPDAAGEAGPKSAVKPGVAAGAAPKSAVKNDGDGNTNKMPPAAGGTGTQSAANSNTNREETISEEGKGMGCVVQ